MVLKLFQKGYILDLNKIKYVVLKLFQKRIYLDLSKIKISCKKKVKSKYGFKIVSNDIYFILKFLRCTHESINITHMVVNIITTFQKP